MGARCRTCLSSLARRRAGSSTPLVVYYASLGTRVGFEDALAFHVIAYYCHVDRSGSLRSEYTSRSLGSSRTPTFSLAGTTPSTTRSNRRALTTPLSHTRPRSQRLLMHYLTLGSPPRDCRATPRGILFTRRRASSRHAT